MTESCESRRIKAKSSLLTELTHEFMLKALGVRVGEATQGIFIGVLVFENQNFGSFRYILPGVSFLFLIIITDFGGKHLLESRHYYSHQGQIWCGESFSFRY